MPQVCPFQVRTEYVCEGASEGSCFLWGKATGKPHQHIPFKTLLCQSPKEMYSMFNIRFKSTHPDSTQSCSLKTGSLGSSCSQRDTFGLRTACFRSLR